jgi:hypothetical protein
VNTVICQQKLREFVDDEIVFKDYVARFLMQICNGTYLNFKYRTVYIAGKTPQMAFNKMKTQSLIFFIETISVELGVSSYCCYSKDNNTAYYFLALENAPHPSYYLMCAQSANSVAVFRFVQFTLQAMMVVAKDEQCRRKIAKRIT